MSEAKIVLSAENRTRAAFAALRGDVEATQKRVSTFSGAVAGALALAPVAAFAAGMSNAIGELDRLGDNAPKIGLTAQGLAELGFAAKMSGTDSATLESAVGKLSTKLADAAGGGKEAVKTFEAIGVKVLDASGKMKASDVIFAEIADRFAEMQEGPLKTALAMDLFGKSGKELIPMLSQGGAGIAALREEFVRLTGGPITDAVQQTGEFNDHLDRLATASQGFFMHLAGELLPVINLVASEMYSTGTSADELSGDVENVSLTAEGLRTILEALVIVASDVGYVFKQTGNEIGGLAAQAAALLSLDFQGFKFIGEAMKQDAEKARKALDDYQNRVLNAKNIDKIKRAAQELEDAYFGGGKGKKPAPILAADAAKAAESEYEKLLSRIRERINIAELEIKAGRALTDEEKFAAKISEDLAKAKGKVSAAERAHIQALVQTSAQRALSLELQRSELRFFTDFRGDQRRGGRWPPLLS